MNKEEETTGEWVNQLDSGPKLRDHYALSRSLSETLKKKPYGILNMDRVTDWIKFSVRDRVRIRLRLGLGLGIGLGLWVPSAT